MQYFIHYFSFITKFQPEVVENGPLSPGTPVDQIGKKKFEFSFHESSLPNCPPTPTKTPARARRKSMTKPASYQHNKHPMNSFPPTPLFSNKKRKKARDSSNWHDIHDLSISSLNERQDMDSSFDSAHTSNDDTFQSPGSDIMQDDDNMIFPLNSPQKNSHKMRKLYQNHHPRSRSTDLSYNTSLFDTSQNISGMDISGIHATNQSFQSISTPYFAKHMTPNGSSLKNLSMIAGEHSEDDESNRTYDSDDDIQMMHDTTPPKMNLEGQMETEFQKIPCRLTNTLTHENPFSPERQRRQSVSPSKRRRSDSSTGSKEKQTKPIPAYRNFSHDIEEFTKTNPPILNCYFSRYMEDFEEISILGEGSFGKVTKCKNRLDGMHYAVKQTSNFIKGQKDEEYVLREVHALATLADNPFIVRYYSSWIEDDRLFVQMELCEQGNIYTYLSNSSPFTERQLIDLLKQVANGLYIMHSASLVHLDIKPDNIYVTGENTYKIGDFGLVASCLEGDRDLMEGDSRYLSKEVLSNNIKDLSKVDIFALGISLYELAHNRKLPENNQEWHDIRDGKLIPFTNHFSPEFIHLVKLMMHPDPDKRPTALELIHHPVVELQLPTYDQLYERNKMLEQRLALYQRDFGTLEE